MQRARQNCSAAAHRLQQWAAGSVQHAMQGRDAGQPPDHGLEVLAAQVASKSSCLLRLLTSTPLSWGTTYSAKGTLVCQELQIAVEAVQDFRQRCCQSCHSQGSESDTRRCPPEEATGSLPTLVFLPSPAAPADQDRQHCMCIAEGMHQTIFACEGLDSVLIQATPQTAAPHAVHAHRLSTGQHVLFAYSTLASMILANPLAIKQHSAFHPS